MSAFGLNRFAQAYAVAVNAAGTRIADKPLSCVDRLAADLYSAPGSLDGGTTSTDRIGELKANFKFVYPFVGNTAVSNSFNLADPSTFRITWNDPGIVHNAFGWTNGPSAGAQADTGCPGPVILADYYVMHGVYCRSANVVAGLDIYTIATSGPSNVIGFYCRHTDGYTYFWSGSNVTSPPSASFAVATPNSQGLFSAFRQAPPGAYYGYRNGSNLGVTSVAVGFTAPMTTWMFNQVGMGRNYSFAFVSNPTNAIPYSHAMQATLYGIIQRFQQRLGRAV